MALNDTDTILVDPDAIDYINNKEIEEGSSLFKFQIIEYFFEWLKKQPINKQVSFIKEALGD